MAATTLAQTGKGRSQSPPPRQATSVIDCKIRQSAKIARLREALLAAGCHSLDRQAAALGLGRSTTWAILQANHKASGLSASIIARILASPGLPPNAKQVIAEYVAEKAAGAYGHSQQRLRIFRAQLIFHGTPILPGLKSPTSCDDADTLRGPAVA